mmetsp:Transcript_37682/g.100269  ORF Transcript_37682/g.100269 Transcript_37682/m.100269 type:complete len:84 (-) Transcript_37682:25-276(-)
MPMAPSEETHSCVLVKLSSATLENAREKFVLNTIVLRLPIVGTRTAGGAARHTPEEPIRTAPLLRIAPITARDIAMDNDLMCE